MNEFVKGEEVGRVEGQVKLFGNRQRFVPKRKEKRKKKKT